MLGSRVRPLILVSRADSASTTIRDALLNDGFDVRAISIAGQGYKVPLVPTPPETAEPRNRRVEITTR